MMQCNDTPRVPENNAQPDMTEMSLPGADGLASIVIPTFNRCELIQDALQSIAAQTWPSVEVIVVDDGSDDGTGAMISSLAETSYPWPITYRWQENAGPGPARNLGRSLARGTYLYHLDSDDVMHPEALSDMIAALEDAGAQFAVGSVANTDIAGRPNNLNAIQHPRIEPGDIVGSGWYTHAALYRRDLVDAVGGYNTDFALGEDTELHWRILLKAGPPAITKTVVADRRVHTFGQLTTGVNNARSMRGSLTLFEHLHGTGSEIMDSDLNRARMFLLGIKFGLISDWDSLRRVRELLSGMLSKRPVIRQLSRGVLAPKSVLYFRTLQTGVDLARGAMSIALKRKPSANERL